MWAIALTRIPEILLSFLGGFFLTFLWNKLSKRKSRKQIKTLTRAIKRYAKEEFHSPLPAFEDEAMDVLIGTMIQIIQNFQYKIDRGEAEEEKLSIILNHMQEGVIGADGSRRILFHNPSF